MPTTQSEAFSRILIDRALEESGWNLLDHRQVQFEYHTLGKRADYLLKDSLGRVLCVLEAKRDDHDPYDAKEQARGYADNLKAPLVVLSNGQFRTPRHIIDLIVALVNPQPGWRICDPACGTAGFLIAAYRHILRAHTKPADRARGIADGSLLKARQWEFLEQHAFTGFDNDANMVKIAILNLYLHQLERARIEHFNPLTTGFGGSYPGQRFDVILANPPFAGKVQDESILTDLNYKLNTRATELLFLKWFIDHLADGGRAGVIVPNGVLFGSTNAATSLRELLLTECDLQAVISLPSGVFRPYAGVATAALIFEKGRKTERVWFYDMTADGFSLDDKRTSIAANDIPDVLAKWPSREEGPNSYRVPIEKIKENGWSLAAGRYKPVTTEAVSHDAPAEILAEVLEIESRITERGNALLEKFRKKL